MKDKQDVIWTVAILTATLVTFTAVNDWSFWGDESSTWKMARIPTWGELIDALKGWNGSESQMPLYICFVWLWEKVFGSSEYALRSSNMLIIVLATGYTIWTIRLLNNREKNIVGLAVVVALLSPFVLYNMNEARVNVSLYSFAAICFLSLYVYAKTHRKCHLYICLASLTLGFAFNMLFAFIVPPLAGLAIYMDKRIFRDNKWASACTLLCCVMVGCYYLWTLVQAKGGQVENPGIANLTYSLYEFMGFNGMGAPKNAIRESEHLWQTVRPFTPWMAVICVAYFLLAWRVAAEKIWKNKLAGLFILSVILFFIGANLAHFRFWGRHLFMLYPLWTVALSSYLVSLWETKKAVCRFPVILFLTAFAISSFRITAMDVYKKENIKETSEYVNRINARGNNVFFIAPLFTSECYPVNHGRDISELEHSKEGYLVFIKSLKYHYGGKNPYYRPEVFDYTPIRMDDSAEIYWFTKKH